MASLRFKCQLFVMSVFFEDIKDSMKMCASESSIRLKERLLFVIRCGEAEHLFLGGGNSNIFYFHPYLGKIPSLTNIFEMG